MERFIFDFPFILRKFAEVWVKFWTFPRDLNIPQPMEDGEEEEEFDYDILDALEQELFPADFMEGDEWAICPY